MPPRWTTKDVSDLFNAVVRLGWGHRASHQDVGAYYDRLRELLDWREGLLGDWAARVLPAVAPEVGTPVQRLLGILHRRFEERDFRRSQFLADLGQVAWDLRDALAGLGSPPSGQWAEQLNQVWPKRPGPPGLTRVAVNNFRCLKSVNVPLKPLTVLIGPNDSGKSAFLAAVECLINGTNFGVTDHWRGDQRVEVSIAGSSSVGEGRLASGTTRTHEPIQNLKPVGKYHLPSQGVPMKGEGQPETELPNIRPGGDGVAALFDHLLRQDRHRFLAARDALRSLVPGLEDLNIGTPRANERRVDLVLENGFRLPADQASAGVRLLITFVALAYHPTPPRVILIEEPEGGVHPKRLADIVRLLREITVGEHGERAAQVILTTHSPYLLNFVNLEADQVLVFRRGEDGARTAEPADSERLGRFLDEFSLGEVWFNRGEEGMVAKKS